MNKFLPAFAIFVSSWLIPVAAPAETFILPARPDLGFAMANVSIPLADYTNCVAYYTAEAPVFNEGQTNYFVPDLSPARNDAVQAVVAYQPLLTDGMFYFEGTDVIETDIYADGSFRWACGFAITETNAVNGGLFGSHDASGKRFCFGLGPSSRYQGAFGNLYNESSTEVDSDYHNMWLGDDFQIYRDGTVVNNLSAAAFSGVSANSIMIGRAGGLGWDPVEMTLKYYSVVKH